MVYNLACHAALHGIQGGMTDSALKQFRRANSLTLADVAEKVGLSESHLSRVEREGTDKMPLAAKLAAVTGLPMEAFARQ
jgi:transcriptional regulator with XRE-family HTH domain